jgi:DNA-binding NarL/FixJ family response regulator
MTADTLEEGNVGFGRGKMAYRILIVDDHEVVRLGLRTLLERHDDIIVVDEAKSADEAVRKAHQHNPDVVIMDIRMPG